MAAILTCAAVASTGPRGSAYRGFLDQIRMAYLLSLLFIDNK